MEKETIRDILDRKGFVKVICKVGGSAGIIFDKKEVDKFNLNIGNTINLEDAFIVEERSKDSLDNKSGLTKED